MNQDPANQKFREISWRRPLTEAEQAEWRAQLEDDPSALADAEAENALSSALAQLPDAPMPSNFTARVLQQIERETISEQRAAQSPLLRWWRVFIPRFALTCLVVSSGFFLWQQHATKKELVSVAREVAESPLLADPTMLSDFEIIARLTPTESVADEGLLALSEDLLAIGQ